MLARMAADMDALADNKTEKLLVRCTSNEGFIAGMAAMIKVGGELRATLPLVVENGYGEAESYALHVKQKAEKEAEQAAKNAAKAAKDKAAREAKAKAKAERLAKTKTE